MLQAFVDFFTSTNILLLIVIAGLAVILWLAKRGIAQGGDAADSRMILYLLIPLILIAGLGVLEVANGTEKIEIQAIFLIVIGVTALIWLLFIVAAGYSHLQLTDVKQALGLPEGSIRAMIALMLLLVFIIFGIFVFNISATGNSSGPAPMTAEQLGQAKNISFIVPIKDKDGTVTGYNAWVRQEITEPAQRLATQLLTTVGTLVVAVAGFYFGSSSVSSAVAAVRPTGPRATIGTIDPLQGKQNTQVSLTITGRNFQVPRAVRLARGNEEVPASDVMASAEKITATVKLDKSPGGDNWDVVIQNADGTETRSEKAFKITS